MLICMQYVCLLFSSFVTFADRFGISLPLFFLSLSLPPSWSNDSWSNIELLVGDQSSWSEHSADCLSRGPLERTVWKCFVNLSCFKGQRIRKKLSLSEKCCCVCVCVCVCMQVREKEREALSASLWLRCPLLVWMLKQLATSSEPRINNFHCLSCRSEICTATARAERWDKRRGEVSRKSWHGEWGKHKKAVLCGLSIPTNENLHYDLYCAVWIQHIANMP